MRGHEERASMIKVSDQITGALMAKFPDLKRDLTPKYNKTFNAFQVQIPLLRFWIRMNMATTGSVVAVAVLATGAVAGLTGIVGRRLCRPTLNPDRMLAAASFTATPRPD